MKWSHATVGVIFFTSRFALADATLVICGNTETTEDQFREMSQSAYQYSNAVGDSKFVLLGPKRWGVGKAEDVVTVPSGKSSGPAKDAIALAIQKAVKDLPPGENLKIFISDHGFEPSAESKPKSSGLYMSRAKVTHQDLNELIRENVPQDRKVILVGAYCYSGGLHNISFENNNVCSAAVTDFRTPAAGGNWFTGIPTYGNSFWKSALKLRKASGSKPALYESHVEATRDDFLNDWRGDLSSFAYVDQVLNQGPYQEKLGFWDSLFGDVPTSNDWDIDQYLKNQKQTTLADTCPQEFPSFVEQMKFYGELLESQPLDLSNLPPSLKKFFEFQEGDWKANRKKLFNEFVESLNYYEDIGKRRSRLDEIIADAKESNNYAVVGSLYEQKMIADEMYFKGKREAQKRLSKYLGRLHMIKRADDVIKFYDVADPKQKTKFEALLKCEQTGI